MVSIKWRTFFNSCHIELALIFAVAAHIAGFTCPAVQRSGQIIFFILSRRDHPFLLPAQLSVRTDFGIKMDIHFIFIKDRMLCAAFVQCFYAELTPVSYTHLTLPTNSRV